MPFQIPFSSAGAKRRKSDKGGKGLRHFSMKVCEKVRKKGTTSYNEVADELVAEFTNPNLIPYSVDHVSSNISFFNDVPSIMISKLTITTRRFLRDC